MSSLQFKPSSQATRRAKVLLLGEAGVGKTHVALTFPKPAVIDAEGSVDWFADRFQFSSVNTKSYQEARDLLSQVRAGRVDCETVVIDSLTTIYNGLLLAASAQREDLRPLDWGRIKRKFSSLLDELYHKLDKHVVCIGWIKPEYAKAGTRVNGKIVEASDLVRVGEGFDGDRKTMYAFDFVFKIEGNDGKKTTATVIKSRSGKLLCGQVITDFSFATIAALLPTGDHAAAGMTDEEQIARDQDEDAAKPAARRTQSRDKEPDAALDAARVAVKEAMGFGAQPTPAQLTEMRNRMNLCLGTRKKAAEFTIPELQAFAAAYPIHREIEELTRDDDDHERNFVQDECREITAESTRGVRYDFHQLDAEEAGKLLAWLTEEPAA